jgi:hypothetical protein
MKTTIELCLNPEAIVIHTDFNIQLHEPLKIIIENIHGVERMDTWGVHKYNFLVEIGSMFDREAMGLKIQQKIKEYFE